MTTFDEPLTPPLELLLETRRTEDRRTDDTTRALEARTHETLEPEASMVKHG